MTQTHFAWMAPNQPTISSREISASGSSISKEEAGVAVPSESARPSKLAINEAKQTWEAPKPMWTAGTIGTACLEITPITFSKTGP